MTGSRVYTEDFKGGQIAGRRIMGILGMDCLRHYCIQLDFAAGKLRFLNPYHLNTAKLGHAFPIKIRRNQPFIHASSLLGGQRISLLIDTGFNADGVLDARYYRRLSLDDSNGATSPNRVAGGQSNTDHDTTLPNSVWSGNTYTNLIVLEAPNRFPNLIGLRFLARHLVTLNFPKRTLYLKQTRIGPLGDVGPLKPKPVRTP